jgi:hypothetical protein
MKENIIEWKIKDKMHKKEEHNEFYVIRFMTYVHRIKLKGLHYAFIHGLIYNTEYSYL